MNVTLWIVQGLLAFAFIAFGGMKLFAYEKFKVMHRAPRRSGKILGRQAGCWEEEACIPPPCIVSRRYRLRS